MPVSKKLNALKAKAEKQLNKTRKRFGEEAKKASLELWPKLADLPKVGAVAAGQKISPEQRQKMKEPAKRRSKARKTGLNNPVVRKARKKMKRAQRLLHRIKTELTRETVKKAPEAAAPAAAAAPAS